MIIDMHTHLIDYDTELSEEVKLSIKRCLNEESWKYSVEDYTRANEAADLVFVFGIRAKATGFLSDNERVAAFVRQQPERYLFVASVDPLDEDFMDQLGYVHGTLGAKMLKIGPIYQGVHPFDDRYRQIYKYCQQRGLPIITHMAATFTTQVPLEYARPALMEQICCEYPDLKVVLAHMGHPWEGEAIVSIRKQPNLYADISALFYRPYQYYHTMRLLEEYGAWRKVFFGSDFPATTTQETIDGLCNINNILEGTALPRVSNELIEGILYSNPLVELDITL